MAWRSPATVVSRSLSVDAHSPRVAEGELSPSARRRVFAVGVLALAASAAAMALSPDPVGWTRARGFDAYQGAVSLGGGAPPSAAAVVIGERSLSEFGSWPWPRTRLADLIDRLAATGPRAVALAIVLDEAGRDDPLTLLRDVPALSADADMRREVEALPDPDIRLAEAFAKTPVATATILGGPAEGGAPEGLPLLGDPLHGEAFAGVSGPRAPLAAAAASTGSINVLPDRDMLLRRAPLVFLVDGVAHPSIAVSALTAAGADPQLEVSDGRPSALRFEGGRVAVEKSGAIWLDFGRRSRVPVIEAAELLLDPAAGEALAGLFVVVGVDAAGIAPVFRTADRQVTSAPLFHALAIDALASGATLRRRLVGPAIEFGALMAGGLMLAALWVRTTPAAAIAATLALPVGWWAAVLAARADAHILLDPLTPSLGLVAVAIACAVARSIEDERCKRRLVAALADGKLAAEREERARSAFLAQFSHELRSPINAIHGAAREISSLSIRSDLGGVLENVHRIEELSGQMRALIAKAVAAAATDSAVPPIEREPLNLATLMAEAVDLASLAAAEIHREAEIDRDLWPARIEGDRVLLVNALVCLVSNAIAHAGLDGPILCRTGYDETDAPYGEVVDQGRSIDETVLSAARMPPPSRALLEAAPGIYGLGLYNSLNHWNRL
jgi:adenylate cyclase